MALTELEELELLELENENALATKKISPDIEKSRETNMGDLAKSASGFLRKPLNFAPFSPIVKSTYGLATSPEAREFGKGFSETASFGALNENLTTPQIISPSMSFSKGMGRAIGSFIPPIVSAATGGQAAAMSGLGKLGQSVATGLTMGAAEGAVKGRGILPAISTSTERGLEFSLIHGAGKALGGLRKVLGEDLSDTLSNLFLKTETKTAQQLARKGEPSLGKQALDFKGKFKNNPLSGFKSRKEVLQKAKDEMGYLRNEASGIVEGIENEARKPGIKPVTNRLLLGYEPNAEKIKQLNVSDSREFKIPVFPEKKYPGTSRIGMSFQEPKIGTMGSFEESGLKTIGGRNISGQFQKGQGQGMFELNENVNPKNRIQSEVKDSYKKQFELNVKNQESRMKSILDENTRIEDLKANNRNWAQDYPFTFEKRGPFINLQDIVTDIMPEINKLKKVGEKTGPAKGMLRILTDFQKSNPENISVNDALMVKTTLDKIVNDAYRKEMVDNAYSDQIYRNIANSLRKKIYKISPKLGENFDKQSLLHDVINSIEPTQAKTGNISIGGFFRFLGQQATGNQLGLGAATVLDKTMGKPSRRIAPFTKIGVQGSLLNYDPLNNNE